MDTTTIEYEVPGYSCWSCHEDLPDPLTWTRTHSEPGSLTLFTDRTQCPACGIVFVHREYAVPDVRDTDPSDHDEDQSSEVTLCQDCYYVAADAPPEEYGCPACGEFPENCQGHGEIGDPSGRAILLAHDDGDHHTCATNAECGPDLFWQHFAGYDVHTDPDIESHFGAWCAVHGRIVYGNTFTVRITPNR